MSSPLSNISTIRWLSHIRAPSRTNVSEWFWNGENCGTWRMETTFRLPLIFSWQEITPAPSRTKRKRRKWALSWSDAGKIIHEPQLIHGKDVQLRSGSWKADQRIRLGKGKFRLKLVLGKFRIRTIIQSTIHYNRIDEEYSRVLELKNAWGVESGTWWWKALSSLRPLFETWLMNVGFWVASDKSVDN